MRDAAGTRITRYPLPITRYGCQLPSAKGLKSPLGPRHHRLCPLNRFVVAFQEPVNAVVHSIVCLAGIILLFEQQPVLQGVIQELANLRARNGHNRGLRGIYAALEKGCCVHTSATPRTGRSAATELLYFLASRWRHAASRSGLEALLHTVHMTLFSRGKLARPGRRGASGFNPLTTGGWRLTAAADCCG
jgi:hypothetical protein